MFYLFYFRHYQPHQYLCDHKEKKIWKKTKRYNESHENVFTFYAFAAVVLQTCILGMWPFVFSTASLAFCVFLCHKINMSHVVLIACSPVVAVVFPEHTDIWFLLEEVTLERCLICVVLSAHPAQIISDAKALKLEWKRSLTLFCNHCSFQSAGW